MRRYNSRKKLLVILSIPIKRRNAPKTNVTFKKRWTLLLSILGMRYWSKPQKTPKKPSEKIEVDFEGVEVLTPSWADEFISALKEKYPNDVILLQSDNASVNMSLDFVGKRE